LLVRFNNTGEDVLKVKNIEVVYDDVILVLKGMSIEAKKESITVLLGSNGAGKSTTLKAISGLLKSEEGEITDGDIIFEGRSIKGKNPEEIVKAGIFQVMEGRRIFGTLTTEENLKVAGYCRRYSNRALKDKIEKIYEYFPRLKERSDIMAGYLSGGEQQMLAIGRALISEPKMILLDEPSLGLAPLLVKELFKIIERINRIDKITILLVEQNADVALSIGNYGYIVENGKVVLEGNCDKLRENEDVKEFYLGISEEGKKSFRNVKHYRRRKRWL